MLSQIIACRTADILDHPERYRAIVRDVHTLQVVPQGEVRPQMVNVDGLRMMVRGPVRVAISGRVRLIAGQVDVPHAGQSIVARRAAKVS